MGRLSVALVLIATLARAELPPQAFGDMRNVRVSIHDAYAWYRFDGNLADSGSQALNLTASGITTNSGYITFDTSGAQRWAKSVETNYLAGATNFTLSFWAKASDANANWLYMWQQTNSTASSAYRGGPESQWRPDVAANRVLLVMYEQAGSGASVFTWTNITIIATTWTHYAFAWGSPSHSNAYCWINGESNRLASSSIFAGATNVPTNSRLFIGNSESGSAGRIYRGSQGRWRVYSRVITDYEARQLFLEGSP